LGGPAQRREVTLLGIAVLVAVIPVISLGLTGVSGRIPQIGPLALLGPGVTFAPIVGFVGTAGLLDEAYYGAIALEESYLSATARDEAYYTVTLTESTP